MKREIKFKRAHFLDAEKTKLHSVSEWGFNLMTGATKPEFISPSFISNALYYTDFQFTGFLDKNKTEIYEGSIIEFVVGSKTNNPETIRAKIIYPVTDNSNGKKTTHAAFGYNAMVDGEREDFYLTLCDVNILNISVIGDISHNPELLTN